MADGQQYVKLPDGSYGAFPSSMKDAEITAAIQKNFPQKSSEQETISSLPNAAEQAKAETQGQGLQMMRRDVPDRMTTRQQEADYERAYNRERAAGNYPLTDFDVASIGLGGMGVGNTIAEKGVLGAIRPLTRTLIGATAGSAAGGYGGRELGRMVGHPEEGAQIGATLGGLSGGFFGAMRGEPPVEPEVTPMSKSPYYAQYKPILSRGGAPAPEVDEVAQAVREGRAAKIPARMPRQTPPVDDLTQAVREGRAMRIPNRMPIKASVQAKAAPFEGMTSTSMQATPPGEPIYIPKKSALMRQPEVQFVDKLTPPSASRSRIILPGTPEAEPPHVEGSYWSFKEPSLRQAVLSGDRDAAIVYKERFGDLPEGAKFLTDVGHNPNRGLYRSEREPRMEQLRRGASGESPEVKSLRRKTEKEQ